MAKRKARQRKVGPKGAQTRRKLIEAAGKLFSHKGIEATSLDDIAAAAGVTKGAIYDNFEDKDDLLYEEYKAHSTMSLPLFVTGTPLRDQTSAVRDKLIAMSPNGLKYVQINAEMNFLLATRATLRRRIIGLNRERAVEADAELQAIPELHGLALKPIEIGFTLALLYNGLLLQRLLMPEVVTEDLMRRVYDVFFSGLKNSESRKRRKKKRAT